MKRLTIAGSKACFEDGLLSGTRYIEGFVRSGEDGRIDRNRLKRDLIFSLTGALAALMTVLLLAHAMGPR